MYGELKVRVYFDESDLAEVGISAKELVNSLMVVESDDTDELVVVPSPFLMPDTWDVVDGPYLICGGSIEERKLVVEVGEEEIT